MHDACIVKLQGILGYYPHPPLGMGTFWLSTPVMISNTPHAQRPCTLTLEHKFLQNANIYQTFFAFFIDNPVCSFFNTIFRHFCNVFIEIMLLF